MKHPKLTQYDRDNSAATLRHMAASLLELADELAAGTVAPGEGCGAIARTSQGWHLDIEMRFDAACLEMH